MDYSSYLKSFCQEVLRPIIVDAVKEAVPKELQKKDKQYYTRKQVCEMLHISVPTFYSYVDKGLLKKVKIEGKTLVEVEEFERAMATKELVRYKHTPLGRNSQGYGRNGRLWSLAARRLWQSSYKPVSQHIAGFRTVLRKEG